MKVAITVLITFLLITLLQAYEWSQFGMDSGEINNFCFLDHPSFMEIICGSDGFYTYETDTWVLHSYGGLPVWDLCVDESGEADLIVILGDGSYSDGIYSYTFDISEFTVRHWFLEPDFLLQDEMIGTYFVGGTSGLVSSEDGVNWQEVSYFNGMNCHAMAIYGSNYIISANDYDLYYSDDAGENWYSAETYLLISDMCFDSTGKLYGIFPDMSWSSGLWSSFDYGQNWQVEFWDVMLNSVFTDLSDQVFVGWKDGISNEGLAQWIANEEGFYFYNYGLPNFNINKITTHPFIDCINIICCTDDSSYMLTDYEITAAGEEIPAGDERMIISPNPFNPETEIRCQVSGFSDQDDLDLAIYNIKGQQVKIFTFLNGSLGTSELFPFSSSPNYIFSVTWDGTDDNGQSVTSGIYFARLVTAHQILQKKMILLK
jgi:hypothetical protein